MLLENKKNGDSFSIRPKFRPVVMHLNAIGGVTILDVLEEMDIKQLVTSKLEQLKTVLPGDDADEKEVAEES